MKNFHHEDGYVTQQQWLYYVVFLVATTYQPRNIGILTSSMGVVSSNDGGVPKSWTHSWPGDVSEETVVGSKGVHHF